MAEEFAIAKELQKSVYPTYVFVDLRLKHDVGFVLIFS